MSLVAREITHMPSISHSDYVVVLKRQQELNINQAIPSKKQILLC